MLGREEVYVVCARLPNTHTPSLTTNLTSRLICLYSGGSVLAGGVMM